MAIPVRCTLFDLVQTVSQATDSDREVVAAVTYLVNSGRVVLCGSFAGAQIDLPPGHEDDIASVRGRYWPLPPSIQRSLPRRAPKATHPPRVESANGSAPPARARA